MRSGMLLILCALGLASCATGSAPEDSPNWEAAVASLPCGDFTRSAPLPASKGSGLFPTTAVTYKWSTSVTIVADGRRFDPGVIEDPAAWIAIEKKFDAHIGPGC